MQSLNRLNTVRKIICLQIIKRFSHPALRQDPLERQDNQSGDLQTPKRPNAKRRYWLNFLIHYIPFLEGQPDSGLTKDYTNSTLHRFKKPGSKNYLNIYPPSSTLHLSNIPPSITEDFLLNAFKEKGFKVNEFQFFQ